MTKDEIREIVRERRVGLGADWFMQASIPIQNAALQLMEFESAKVVCAYSALPHEVQTDLIFKAVWDSGRKLCVPALRSEGRGYGMAELLPTSRLVEGGASVFEPEEPNWVDIDEVDIAFIPGVAFDRTGGRLGHGRGHIDRMLAERKESGMFKVGMAYEFQLFDEVPQNEFDIKMNMVIK
jgi:5-formyltetrahydrofolate cyclo-ligase